MTHNGTVRYPLDITQTDWTTQKWDDDVGAVRALASRRRFTGKPIVFYGSSSFRYWHSIAEDLERLDILNLGFGGATVESAIRYFETLFEGVGASRLVLYVGENDIASDGLTAAHVMQGIEDLLALLRARYPSTPVYFCSIKHSPSRWLYADEFEKLNSSLKLLCEGQNMLRYIDLSSCLLGKNGRPIGKYFMPDQVHLNASGYLLWAKSFGAAEGLFAPA